MINVSNEFLEKMQESRAFIYTAEITFPDGTEMTINHDDMNFEKYIYIDTYYKHLCVHHILPSKPNSY